MELRLDLHIIDPVADKEKQNARKRAQAKHNDYDDRPQKFFPIDPIF